VARIEFCLETANKRPEYQPASHQKGAQPHLDFYPALRRSAGGRAVRSANRRWRSARRHALSSAPSKVQSPQNNPVIRPSSKLRYCFAPEPAEDGHRHDIAADGDDELGACRQPHLAHRQNVAAGAPLILASVVKLNCVLAMHIGKWPKPCFSKSPAGP